MIAQKVQQILAGAVPSTEMHEEFARHLRDAREKIRRDVLLEVRETPVSKDDKDMLYEVMARAKNNHDDTLVIMKFDMNMTQGELNALKGRNWLNDGVINFYLEMLNDRETKKPIGERSYAMSSFFFNKLSIDPTANGYNFDAVIRWFQNVDMYTIRKFFFPINVTNAHWYFVEIDFDKRQITSYDSLRGARHEFEVNTTLRWVGDMKKHLRTNAEQMKSARAWILEEDESAWTVNGKGTFPVQKDGHNCGVFTVIGIDRFIDDLPFVLRETTQEELRERANEWRMHIGTCILRGEIPY